MFPKIITFTGGFAINMEEYDDFHILNYGGHSGSIFTEEDRIRSQMEHKSYHHETNDYTDLSGWENQYGR